MRRVIPAIIATLALLIFSLAPAGADGLSLPVDTVVVAAEGSLIELGRLPVDGELAGPLCVWSATVINQSSVHFGNDILVRSGDSTLVLSGVEDSEMKTTTNSGSAYLADEVIIELRMGPDGVFSGGLDLTIDYSSCQETTTTTTMDAIVVEPIGPTATTAPAPAGPTTAELTTTTTTATAPVQPSTTIAVAPAQQPIEPILPVTGSREALPLAFSGLALIGLGIALTRATRQPNRH